MSAAADILITRAESWESGVLVDVVRTAAAILEEGARYKERKRKT